MRKIRQTQYRTFAKMSASLLAAVSLAFMLNGCSTDEANELEENDSNANGAPTHIIKETVPLSSVSNDVQTDDVDSANDDSGTQDASSSDAASTDESGTETGVMDNRSIASSEASSATYNGTAVTTPSPSNSQPAATATENNSQSSQVPQEQEITPERHCQLYGHSWKTHQETIPAQYETIWIEGGWYGTYVIRDYDDFYYTQFQNRDEAQAYADSTGLYVSWVQPHHRNSYKSLTSPESTKTVSICQTCGKQK